MDIVLNMTLMLLAVQLGVHRNLILLIAVLQSLFLFAVEANKVGGKGKR